ncbi:pre-peptidase C-terminal domain-containing protein [Bacillus suaedaesalsae]|uniref:Peptidase C-terminal archaeal/bacterial domain-containing protein n=1 Tax=Bacillus suaedaesalsae TaxID=2810349 RepID=A0ABS2DKU5_9BACI|nr:pre-peptidase C-terminal domain-containing protein [Bacillus suaedaesalsae]MBM6619115.1 hypothetical protein [Bacillus suaedaesalsae]
MKKYIIHLCMVLSIVIASLGFGGGNVLANYGLETMQTAQQIDVNKIYEGMLNGSGDYQDYYKFTIPSSGLVTFNINNYPGHQWDYEILDSNGNIFSEGHTNYYSNALGVTASRVGLPKGTYYININENFNTKDKKYYFAVYFNASSTVETEFNNTSITANTISTNTKIKGEIQYSSDYDYYKFTLPEDGVITLNMSQKANLAWDLTLINADGEEYFTTTTSYSTNVTKPLQKTVGLPKGTYYLLIDDDFNSEFDPYEFSVNYHKTSTYEKEFNNNAQSANKISTGKLYQGHMQYGSDVDYYTFSVTKPTVVELQMNRKPYMAWDVALYNSNGDELGYFTTQSGQFAKGVEIAKFNLPAGNYYISVDDDYNSTNQPYSFIVKQKSSSISSKSLKVTNHVGKADTVTIGSLI